MKTVTVKNRSSVTGEEGTPIEIEIETLANHPGKVVARLKGYHGWQGPWDTERQAIKALQQIYSIDGP